MKPKVGSGEKINKIDKPLARLAKKIEKNQITNIRKKVHTLLQILQK